MKEISPNKQKSKIRTLIITPYKMIQESLKILIEGNQDMSVTSAIDSLDNLSESTKFEQIDVVLIYLMEGDVETVESISKILEIAPGVRVVFVASSEDFRNQTRAIQLGAVGIVQKEQNSKMLIEAIRQTYRGETWINQVLLSKLLNEKEQKKNSPKNWNLIKSQLLTRREKEVVELIGRGLKNKEIAQKLNISEATVRHHLSSIYGKLGVEDRLNLVIYAYQQGLIQLTDEPAENVIIEKPGISIIS